MYYMYMYYVVMQPVSMYVEVISVGSVTDKPGVEVIRLLWQQTLPVLGHNIVSYVRTCTVPILKSMSILKSVYIIKQRNDDIFQPSTHILPQLRLGKTVYCDVHVDVHAHIYTCTCISTIHVHVHVSRCCTCTCTCITFEVIIDNLIMCV